MRATRAQNTKNPKCLSAAQREELLLTLKARFEKNINRHIDLEWAQVQAKLEANPEKLWTLYEMERTGGEPDVIGHDKQTGEHIFCDCSPESPKAAEVSATTVRRWSHGKNTNQQIAPWIWQPSWALSF